MPTPTTVQSVTAPPQQQALHTPQKEDEPTANALLDALLFEHEQRQRQQQALPTPPQQISLAASSSEEQPVPTAEATSPPPLPTCPRNKFHFLVNRFY
jgi:hypothetical protein